MFESLDFIYMPSRDVAADARYFTEVLGARLVFAIDAMGTRVAMIEPAESAPRLLLTDHLEGDAPVLVYRVENLPASLDEMDARGWQRYGGIELPMGPACSFHTPGGQRIALYELTRPQVVESFYGRRDFDI